MFTQASDLPAAVFSRSFSRLTRLARLSLIAAATAGAMALAPAPAAAQTLTTTGATLSDVAVNVAAAEITRAVSLGGDVPAATYVMAHMPDGKSLQRTNLGYWIPWDGKTESLVDNGFVPQGDTLTFKILRQDIGDRMFPITFVIAYRTASAVKFGVFQVSPL